MSIQIGQQAPSISLYNSEKEKVNLQDYLGKNIVLLFFPQSFTGVCTEEMCGIRDNYSVYENLNANVFGISVDSVNTLAEFKKQNNINFNLLSDFNKEVSRAYDCIYEDWVLDMKGVAKRSAFVVDVNGVIQYCEVLENPGNQPNFEAIKNKLNELV